MTSVIRRISSIAVMVTTCICLVIVGCRSDQPQDEKYNMTAEQILGNPAYHAISYGGYRMNSRDAQPSVGEIKEDLRILHRMGIRILRTYNVHLPHATNVLKAITELIEEDRDFEMYVMLGIWIDCKNAWTEKPPIHHEESVRNQAEVDKAIELANAYQDIVKVLAVGNEAMVKWATSYYVEPHIILKYVLQLQEEKEAGRLPSDLWITSSDNFASWGGGDTSYHVPALEQLVDAVDYISIHTYPMHDTHYNPDFWKVPEGDISAHDTTKIGNAMDRSLQYAQDQYASVQRYIQSLGSAKAIHIGETGWASQSNGFYGIDGTKACDEYKQKLYYDAVRSWTDREGISCFYFEAFDEPWKDAANPGGSENHFGLFDVYGNAKYVLWDKVDQDIFEGLGRSGKEVGKTYDGNIKALRKSTLSLEAMALGQ